jgi:protein-disulfide isomerase
LWLVAIVTRPAHRMSRGAARRGAMERDLVLARELGVNGTPVFIVGEELYPGLPPAGWLEGRVAKALRRAQ